MAALVNELNTYMYICSDLDIAMVVTSFLLLMLMDGCLCLLLMLCSCHQLTALLYSLDAHRFQSTYAHLCRVKFGTLDCSDMEPAAPTSVTAEPEAQEGKVLTDASQTLFSSAQLTRGSRYSLAVILAPSCRLLWAVLAHMFPDAAFKRLLNVSIKTWH